MVVGTHTSPVPNRIKWCKRRPHGLLLLLEPAPLPTLGVFPKGISIIMQWIVILELFFFQPADWQAVNFSRALPLHPVLLINLHNERQPGGMARGDDGPGETLCPAPSTRMTTGGTHCTLPVCWAPFQAVPTRQSVYFSKQLQQADTVRIPNRHRAVVKRDLTRQVWSGTGVYSGIREERASNLDFLESARAEQEKL